ncbi:MAG: hypothetical protein K2N38_11725 [Oscillospiraceae bacterium]|nr:hypothetical protein [Oscillospiraceae bacterium]
MYKNNFDELFDEIYSASEIKRFALPFRRFSDHDQNAYYHFLADVLNNCFDEEITVSDSCMDRYEYEKSSPEYRYANFERALFSSSDLGLLVVTSRAEISVYDVLISEPDMTNDPENVFDNTSATVMIFAAVHFPNRPNITLDKVKMAVFLYKRSEKIYVSEYEDTLYVEIDYKKLSADRMSKEYVRRACLSACDYISLILDIVEQI